MTEPVAPRLRTLALDPVRAEVAVDLAAWPLEPGDEVRGRLVGPHCRFASTVEIAYPIRRRPGTATYHVLVPEPSLWAPETPFVYGGKIEWFRGGEKRGEAPLLHVFFSLRKTPVGWRLNGEPFTSREIQANEPTEEELLAWRTQGFNVLAGSAPHAALLERAARLGFLLRTSEGRLLGLTE